MMISEIFFSVQGEGLYIGQPEVFVRTSGCNLGCSWCDTAYALDGGREMRIDEIVQNIESHGCRRVSVTGGEPLLQAKELMALIEELKGRDYWICLHTNGTLYDKNIFERVDFLSIDAKPPSSMMESDMDVIRMASRRNHQIKIVIKTDEDLEFAGRMQDEFPDSPMILQPEGGKDVAGIFERLDRLDKNKNVRILPQLHKLVNMK